MRLAHSHLISIRDCTRGDIELMADYWLNGTEEFYLGIGVRRENLPTREQLLNKWEERQEKDALNPVSTSPSLAIRYEGRTIGNHSVSDVVPGESAMMHAHIFEPGLRGKGLGKISYLKAMHCFFERFNLQYMDFKTPKLNPSPNRLKQSLGIPIIGETVLNRPIVLPDLAAWHYRISREDFYALYEASIGDPHA